jgi:hypothetical protein
MKGIVPFAAILLILLAPILSPRVEQPAVKRAFWLTVYTYELPKEALTEGTHTYQFEFHYTSPKPGELIGKVRQVSVSGLAPETSGVVLLRPGGAQGLIQGSFETLKQVAANKPALLMVAWVPNVSMTEAQIRDQLASMKATVRWDNGPALELKARQLTESWEPLWNCRPWVNPSGIAVAAQPALMP